jgi:hypothetical protein
MGLASPTLAADLDAAAGFAVPALPFEMPSHRLDGSAVGSASPPSSDSRPASRGFQPSKGGRRSGPGSSYASRAPSASLRRPHSSSSLCAPSSYPHPAAGGDKGGSGGERKPSLAGLTISPHSLLGGLSSPDGHSPRAAFLDATRAKALPI